MKLFNSIEQSNNSVKLLLLLPFLLLHCHHGKHAPMVHPTVCDKTRHTHLKCLSGILGGRCLIQQLMTDTNLNVSSMEEVMKNHAFTILTLWELRMK